ncbi:MAG: hypothetical protein WCL08_00010 [Verrucomicrobiota bacterium]
MRPYRLILTLLLAGCTHTPSKARPSVSAVKQSLTATKASIEAAGNSNTKAASHVKTALELAEELESLLTKIEKEKK